MPIFINWKSTAAYKFRVGGHINLQEARALVGGVSKLAVADITPRRIVVFMDSAVCGGIFQRSFEQLSLKRNTEGM